MLTPRLPLYIPCAYAVFQYVCFVAGCKFCGNGFQCCCLAGLMNALFYSLYVLVGGKFLWWTLHTTDAVTVLRLLGVPIGNTMWTMVHVFVFSYILHLTVMNSKGGSMDLVKGIVASGFLSTLAMMVMMSPFQLHQLKLKVDWESWAIDFDESQFPGEPDPQAISLRISRSGSWRATRYKTLINTCKPIRLF